MLHIKAQWKIPECTKKSYTTISPWISLGCVLNILIPTIVMPRHVQNLNNEAVNEALNSQLKPDGETDDFKVLYFHAFSAAITGTLGSKT